MSGDNGEYCTVVNNAARTAQHKGITVVSGTTTTKDMFTTTTDSYCVAQFFIYHAEDLGSWVYGINRYGSSSSVAAGLVDVPNYDGVKAFQYSIQRSAGDLVYGRKYDVGATTYGANPIFKQRGKFYGTCNLTTLTADATHCNNDSPLGTDIVGPGMANVVAGFASTDAKCPATKVCGSDKIVNCVFNGEATNSCVSTNSALTDFALRTSAVTDQLFMGDGREDDSATALSTVSVQSQKYTRCLVCHGSQEFTIPQAQSSGKILLI